MNQVSVFSQTKCLSRARNVSCFDTHLEGSIFGINSGRLFFFQLCEQASNVILYYRNILSLMTQLAYCLALTQVPTPLHVE